jgi:hypothetical protein
MIPKCIHKVCIVDGFELPELPKGIDEAIRTWKEYNPDYELKVYSGNDCRKYIQLHYDDEMLRYFDTLKPYSYKADLFRFLVLYNEGGWYSDLRQVCKYSLHDLDITGHEFYTSLDAPPNHMCMYTAFIGSVRKHPILKKTIDIIKWNIDHEHYGLDCLYPTGPGAYMYGAVDYVRKYPQRCAIGKHIIDRDGSEYVVIGKRIILKCKYNNAVGANNDDLQGTNDYGKMWRSGDIYLKHT